MKPDIPTQRDCGCEIYEVCPHEDPERHAKMLAQSKLGRSQLPFTRKLNDEFDPTDANRAMRVAFLSLVLMRYCEQILLDKQLTNYRADTMRAKMEHLASVIFPELSSDDLHATLERELATLGSVV